MLKRSQPWLFSSKTDSFLHEMSWMTFFVVLYVLDGIFAPEVPIQATLSHPTVVMTTFWVTTVILFLILLGEISLWGCMLWFCLRYYEGSFRNRFLCVASQLVFLSAASAVLYYSVYRQRRKELLTTANTTEASLT